MKKKEAIETIRNSIQRNDKAVYCALIKIYNQQTAQEQRSEDTIEDNGVGFSGVDGKILSSFAGFYRKTGFLTVKQMLIARNKLCKYAGQLLKQAINDGKWTTIGRDYQLTIN